MENKILKQAIASFMKNFGVQIKIEEFQHDNYDLRIDAVLKIKIQQMELKFFAEIKSTMNSSVIGFMMHHKNDFPNTKLLVSNYINPVMAEKLKDNDINFIDTAGNAYINARPVFIFVKGNKEKKLQAASFKGKTFTQSGLKMIYALLCEKKLLNRPYREIAGASGIALGTVGQVINNLKKQGFVIDMRSRGKKLTNSKALFDRWCMDYAEKLKPKLFLGTFVGPDDFWKQFHLESDQGQWGGEVAAFKLTNYLKPGNAILYVKEEKLRDIVIQNRLKRAEKGNIEIFKIFWPIDDKEDKPIVHPFMIYADLLEINNQRTIETAKMIYDQNIARYFRKS
ncbi:MAG: type IV toxin-antitoxin system AbiEi family antitoxin [Deltaproteobacteria bacterium]|jgi:hypothetical protein|nr:type IV toxin-antitoxin system AbiEi family antitoxin [Deltaproteobacteria bacterium]